MKRDEIKKNQIKLDKPVRDVDIKIKLQKSKQIDEQEK